MRTSVDSQSITTNQGQEVNISIPHPHKIILNIVPDFNNWDTDYLRGIVFNVAM